VKAGKMAKAKRPAKPRKKTRRLKGTGAVFFSERLGKYVGRVIVGRHPTGRPKYVQRSSGTAEGLNRALAEVRPPADGTTVGAWLDLWLKQLACKPATRRNRTAAVTYHLKPSLGHLRVAELTPRQVELAWQSWRQTRGGAAVPLHPNTARLYVTVLGVALRAAVRHGLRPDNPVASAQKPRGVKLKLDPFTPGELDRIATEAAARPATRVVALLAATGLRVGEALALDAGDFDPAAGTVAVTKTLDGADRSLGTPKSANSTRTVRVPAEPPGALAALKAAIGRRTSGPAFLTGAGRRVVYPLVNRAWKRLLARLGLRHRALHALRHAVASHLLAATGDVAEVAAFLGDSPQMVLATYAHATKRSDPAAALEGVYRGLRSGAGVTSGGAKPPAAPKKRAKRR
jgi:integrase